MSAGGVEPPKVYLLCISSARSILYCVMRPSIPTPTISKVLMKIILASPFHEIVKFHCGFPRFQVRANEADKQDKSVATSRTTIGESSFCKQKAPCGATKWRALKESNLRCNPVIKRPSASLCCSFAKGRANARIHRHPPKSKLPLASHSLSLSNELGFLRGVFRFVYFSCGYKFSTFPYTQGVYMTHLEVTAEFHRVGLKQAKREH